MAVRRNLLTLLLLFAAVLGKASLFIVVVCQLMYSMRPKSTMLLYAFTPSTRQQSKSHAMWTQVLTIKELLTAMRMIYPKRVSADVH